MNKPVVVSTAVIFMALVSVALIFFTAGVKFALDNNESKKSLETMNNNIITGVGNEDGKSRENATNIKYRTVKIFYYDFSQDMCNDAENGYKKGLVAGEREVPDSDNIEDVIRDTVNLLLRGELKESEKGKEIYAMYPLEDFELKDVALDKEGVLSLTFADPKYKTSGGSCQVGVLRSLLDATVKQFSEVKKLEILPKNSDLFAA